MLESTDKCGNTIKSEHIRCRGIPTSCTQCKAGHDKVIAWGMYKSICKCEVISNRIRFT